MANDLPIGQYQGIDGIGEWGLLVTDSGVLAYALRCIGRRGHCGISTENVYESAGALLELHRYYQTHPLSEEERCQMEWRAHLHAMPWWRRWTVKLWRTVT